MLIIAAIITLPDQLGNVTEYDFDQDTGNEMWTIYILKEHDGCTSSTKRNIR
jgi:hypothetical protein